MKATSKRLWALVLTLAAVLTLLTGCMSGGVEDEAQANQAQTPANQGPVPQIPQQLTLVEGVPQLTVYDVDSQSYRQMDMETYVCGVLAGEMRNDWPMEALKAQAILARTYALKFMQDKKSQYSGADISTDIQEAQAYVADNINQRIEKAVEETRGQVLSYEGELPIAWFHAHSGGKTELARAGLDYDKEEPGYTQSVLSSDSAKAPTTVKSWTCQFTAEEVGQAAADAGVRTGVVKTIEVGERGSSGRATTLIINGKEVSAPALRLALDSTRLKSTLLTQVKVEGDTVTFSGKGYGHGVGMSQWGAYAMAEEGQNAQDIIGHYFKDVQVVSLWS